MYTVALGGSRELSRCSAGGRFSRLLTHEILVVGCCELDDESTVRLGLHKIMELKLSDWSLIRKLVMLPKLDSDIQQSFMESAIC